MCLCFRNILKNNMKISEINLETYRKLVDRLYRQAYTDTNMSDIKTYERRRVMKKLRYIIALLLVSVLVVGCGEKKEKPSNEPEKKVLRLAKDTDLSTMDHHIATDGLSFEVIGTTIVGLYELNADGTPVPELATAMETNDEKTIYTFTIRDDAVWENGTPVTANDFVFAWRRLADPLTASEYSFIIETVKLKNYAKVLAGELPTSELGVKALDEKTLQVELELPVEFLLSLMAFPSFFPLNEEFYNTKKDQYALSPENILSNGPFKLTEWVQGNSFVVTKNETFYDKDSIALDQIEFKVIQDTQSAMMVFEQGNFDVVKLTGELVDLYKNRDEYISILEGYLWYLSVNHLVPELANENLRFAIGLSYDREKIANNVLKDGSVPAEYIIPRGSATGPDGKDFRETAQKYLKTDKAKALEYWNKAKQELNVNSVTLELLFEDTEASKSVAEFIKSEVESTLPGVTLNLKSQPKKSRLELMRNQNYQIGLTRWGPDYADPQTYLDLFVSTNVNNNVGRYKSLVYDKFVLDGTTGELASNPEARWESFKQAEATLLGEDAAILPVYQTGGAFMSKTNVSGIEYHAVGITNYQRASKK